VYYIRSLGLKKNGFKLRYLLKFSRPFALKHIKFFFFMKKKLLVLKNRHFIGIPPQISSLRVKYLGIVSNLISHGFFCKRSYGLKKKKKKSPFFQTLFFFSRKLDYKRFKYLSIRYKLITILNMSPVKYNCLKLRFLKQRLLFSFFNSTKLSFNRLSYFKSLNVRFKSRFKRAWFSKRILHKRFVSKTLLMSLKKKKE